MRFALSLFFFLARVVYIEMLFWERLSVKIRFTRGILRARGRAFCVSEKLCFIMWRSVSSVMVSRFMYFTVRIVCFIFVAVS